MAISALTWALVLGGCIVALYRLYQALLPRPIPGIPYNKAAAASPLGDMPALVRHAKHTGEIFDWLAEQNVKHSTPIVQVFGRPLSRPWVVISDFRESEDILMRRAHEFDRSAFTADMLGGVIPEHHSRLRTGEEYRRRKRLVDKLLTPSFLNGTCAPLLHKSTTHLVALWREKARLARGRPFWALNDISCCALDAVLAFTYGPGLQGLSATQPNVEFLSSLAELDDDNDDAETKAAVFPDAPHSSVIKALFAISDSIETAMKSPFPVVAHWFLRQRRHMKTAIGHKEAMISRQIDLAIARVAQKGAGQSGEEGVRCAIDEMVRRESAQAAKEQRFPCFHTRLFYDELYGFTLGGHESTSNANQWALKILARHQSAQNKLRGCLRAALPLAVTEGRLPSAAEVAAIQCPYLEATIEELFRIGLTAPMCVRSVVRDSYVLGRRIPKDTIVFHVWGKAGYTRPGFQVEEELRSEAARAAHEKDMELGVKGADDAFLDPATYAPERWLTTSKLADGTTKEFFDPKRAHNMIFSLGPRSCYGRKLAYLQFRLLLVLVVWTFQLCEVPPELDTDGAYDKLTREPHNCYVRLGEPVIFVD